jgi:hypothetical protein
MTNYFKHKMRSKKPGEIVAMIIFGGIIVVGLIALFGYVTMWLWNTLMPAIFGLATVTYWQAVGLLLLAKLFFGGFEGGRGKGSSKKRHKSHKYDPEHRSDFSKWDLYDKYWREEGEAAYQAYVARSRGESETSEEDEAPVNDGTDE